MIHMVSSCVTWHVKVFAEVLYCRVVGVWFSQ